MKAALIASAALLSLGAAAVQAQESVHWAVPTAQTGRYLYFPTGTAVSLTTRTELSTRDNRPGEKFYMEVAEPLVYRGQVVLPAGSLAVGEVRRVDRNGYFGKKGTLGVQFRYVHTPQGPVRLTGVEQRSGKGQGVLAIGGALFVAWPMLFIHGRSGVLPAGTVITAQLADDFRFPVAVDQAPATAAASAERVVADARPVASAASLQVAAVDRR